MTKNGENDNIQIISLEYIYDDDTKIAGYASFIFAALIVILVFYQVKKNKLQKKIAK